MDFLNFLTKCWYSYCILQYDSVFLVRMSSLNCNIIKTMIRIMIRMQQLRAISAINIIFIKLLTCLNKFIVRRVLFKINWRFREMYLCTYDGLHSVTSQKIVTAVGTIFNSFYYSSILYMFLTVDHLQAEIYNTEIISLRTDPLFLEHLYYNLEYWLLSVSHIFSKCKFLWCFCSVLQYNSIALTNCKAPCYVIFNILAWSRE
jgi:hypothetical protein